MSVSLSRRFSSPFSRFGSGCSWASSPPCVCFSTFVRSAAVTTGHRVGCGDSWASFISLPQSIPRCCWCLSRRSRPICTDDTSSSGVRDGERPGLTHPVQSSGHEDAALENSPSLRTERRVSAGRPVVSAGRYPFALRSSRWPRPREESSTLIQLPYTGSRRARHRARGRCRRCRIGSRIHDVVRCQSGPDRAPPGTRRRRIGSGPDSRLLLRPPTAVLHGTSSP